MPNSAPSLSVVLPVHNAEQTLVEKVSQLLEILPDLTPNFEVLVINDASTDHTEEVAYDLARVYPQVRIKRHQERRGHSGAVETGLSAASGDILFVQDEEAAIDSSKFHRLWDLRNEEDLVMARPEFRVKRSLLQRLAAWGVRLEDGNPGGNPTGVQMIRRHSLSRMNALESMTPASSFHSRSDKADSPIAPKFGAADRSRAKSAI